MYSQAAGFLPFHSAELSENLQSLSHCHCFNNNDKNNENSYGSLKNLESFFWHGPCTATALQGGCHCPGSSPVSMYRVHWFALCGTMVYQEGYISCCCGCCGTLFLWCISGEAETERKLPEIFTPKCCINMLKLYFSMF